MLSRAADNLYWMTRYVERAEAMARILDVAQRMSLQTAGNSRPGGRSDEWEAALIIAGCDKSFALHGGTATRKAVIDFLAFAPDNPSSIHACLKAARENARAMRAQITTEAWESINAAWLEMQTLTLKKVEADGFRRSSTGCVNAASSSAASPRAPCSATMPTASCGWARCWNAPIPPRAYWM